MLFVCVVWIVFKFLDVLQLGLFLFQKHVSFVQFKVLILELLNLLGRLRILLDLQHELSLEISAEFSLLLECFFE